MLLFTRHRFLKFWTTVQIILNRAWFVSICVFTCISNSSVEFDISSTIINLDYHLRVIFKDENISVLLRLPFMIGITASHLRPLVKKHIILETYYAECNLCSKSFFYFPLVYKVKNYVDEN